MIEQLLFTSPGERVMRPDFGSGVMQMVFAPNSPEIATATQFALQAALQKWLGDVIAVRQLSVTAVDSTLTVSLSYLVRATSQLQNASFQRSL
jgi:phage baseplate assembly protein W